LQICVSDLSNRSSQHRSNWQSPELSIASYRLASRIRNLPVHRSLNRSRLAAIGLVGAVGCHSADVPLRSGMSARAVSIGRAICRDGAQHDIQALSNSRILCERCKHIETLCVEK
jgi:hypothetical protein